MRTFVISAVLVGGLVTFASLASAQEAATPQGSPTTPATTTAVTPPPAQNPDDVVTCRYEKVTGSLFTSRICHTKRDWARQNRDAHDALDRLDGGTVQGQQSNAGGG